MARTRAGRSAGGRSRAAEDPERRRRHEAVAALVIGAFLADLVLGGVSPIFPLFAKHLGASNADLAALVTATGLASLALVVPAARLADRLGKRYVFTAGVALHGVAALVLAGAGGVAVLALPNALLGAAGVCTWTIGIACLADTVTGPALSKAVGFYTAAMGAGYGVGPLVTGWSVGTIGYRATFSWAGLLGVAAAAAVLVALWRVRAGTPQAGTPQAGAPQAGAPQAGAPQAGAPQAGAPQAGAPQAGAPQAGAPEGRGERDVVAPGAMRRWLPAGSVLLASYASLPTTLSVNIGLLTFFPVYAATLGWSTATIGALLFCRASSSAVARLAMRSLQRVSLPPLAVIRSTLFVETAVLGLVALSRSLTLTVVLLALEGANYGITMSLAQLTIVSVAKPGSSASSLVWYNAASSVAQLGGGALVAALVSGSSARHGLLVVMAICFALAVAYAGLMGWRRRVRGRAPLGAAHTG